METKHTPGPLTIIDNSYEYDGAVHSTLARLADGMSRPVCIVLNPSRDAAGKVLRDVNAEHLRICWNACEGLNPAAVPDLLAALEALTQLKAKPFMDSNSPYWAINEDDRTKILAAIAKAAQNERT